MTKKLRKTKKEQPAAMNHPVKQIRYWEKWWALALLVLILMSVFYYDFVWGGKTFQPPDTMTSRATKPFVNEATDSGTYPLWCPYIFSGMPSFASLMAAKYIDPVNDAGLVAAKIVNVILRQEDDFYLVIVIQFLINQLLLFFGVFLLMKHGLHVSHATSLVGALIVLMLPQVVSYTAHGHNSKLSSIALTPWILLAVFKALDKKQLLYTLATALGIGVQLLRGHMQICFYTYLAVAIYYVFWAINEIREKRSAGSVFGGMGLLACAAILGLLVSAVLNLSVWEYSHYSMRGGGASGGLNYDYATNWSFPPADMATFLIPSFMGFGGQTYWGQIYFTDFPQYFGLVVLLLAGLAIAIRRDRLVWFLIALSGITLIISFGKHLPLLYGPMFRFMPLFNKFRAPKMIQIVFNLCMVMLAGVGLDALIKMGKENLAAKSRTLRIYLLSFGGVIVLFMFILIAGKSAYSGWVSDSLGAKYGQSNPAAFQQIAGLAHGMAMGDAVKAFFLYLFGAGAIWLAIRQKMRMKALPVYLCLLAGVDLWMVDQKIMEPRVRTAEAAYFQETPEVAYLKKQTGPFRILTAFDAYQRPANWYMYHKLQTTDGYSPAKLQIYQDFMDAFGMPASYGNKYLKQVRGQTQLRDVDDVDDRLKQIHDTYLRLLNVRYLVSRAQLPDTSWKMVYPPQQRGANAVFEYQHALPRVFFPREIVTVSDANGVLPVIARPGFDPAKTAVLEENPAFEIQSSTENMAKITEYDLHRITIQADVKTSALMVLSEVYYPAGWKAYVDGVETKIFKTNYVLRSVFLEPGQHTVEFVFNPQAFRLGLMISFATSLLLIAGVVMGLRQRKKSQWRVD